MEVIRLSSDVYGAILSHAREMLPTEAVGLLGGPAPGYANLSIPLPNRASHHAFLADPYAQFRAERDLARLGLQIVAIYHSHPGGGVQLSPLDVIFARKRACVQIVIALGRAHTVSEEMRAYRMIESVTVEVRIDV